MPTKTFQPLRNQWGVQEPTIIMGPSTSMVAPTAADETQLNNQQGGTVGAQPVSQQQQIANALNQWSMPWLGAAILGAFAAYQSRGVTQLAIGAGTIYAVMQARKGE